MEMQSPVRTREILASPCVVFTVMFIVCLGVGEREVIFLSPASANEVQCRMLSTMSIGCL